MGDLADDALNGDMCEWCGEWIGLNQGFPGLCSSCAREKEQRDRKAAKK